MKNHRTTTPKTAALQTRFDEALRQHQAGQREPAAKLYREILAEAPQHADAQHLLGLVLLQNGQPASAAEHIRQALRLNPHAAIYHNNLGLALRALGELDNAIRHYNQAIKLQPDYAEAHNNLGIALKQRGDLAGAQISYEHAIALKPAYAEAHSNLGNLLRAQGRQTEAQPYFERALALRPDSAELHINLGSNYHDQGDLDAALQHYERAQSVNPRFADAPYNKGVVYKDKGQFESAQACYAEALALNPQHADARFNQGFLALLKGDFAAGWPAYEARWHKSGQRPHSLTQPLWDGHDFRGQTLLLHAEQGLGDSLQFVRYAPLVKQRGGTVILRVQPQLTQLFQSIKGPDHIIAEDEPVPPHDKQAPLMSLPLLLGTTLATIPKDVPYLLPPPDKAAAWTARLADYPGLKIGLVWAGNPRRDDPQANAVDRRRSMRLEQFAFLAKIPNTHIFSLQKGEAAEQATTSSLGFRLIDFMPDIQNFADTAALVANLDLVIGVDTSVIHLAGALAKPVWLLSRHDNCWRWLQERTDSPWYPTLRLFRQPKPADWASVTAEVEARLLELPSTPLPRAT